MPDLRFPVIYYMPSSSQRGLLYLALFFHEFGHLLYACHKREMDDLIRSLLEEIENLLKPVIELDDQYSQSKPKIPYF